jgi:adenylate cyclase
MRSFPISARGYVLGVVGLVVLLLAFWLTFTDKSLPVLNRLEEQIYDSYVAALPRQKPDPRIVIVGMDDASLEKMGRPFYPLPRTDHAHLVEKLTQAGARVIAFDVMFSKERPTEDAIFAEALKKHGNVLAARIPTIVFKKRQEWVTFAPPARTLAPYLTTASIVVPQPPRYLNAWRVDNEKPGVRVPHLALAAVATYYDEEQQPPYLDEMFHWGTHIKSPTDEEGNLLIRYIGKAGTFPVIPYAEALNSQRPEQISEQFRGKIVFVGRISATEDTHETPRGTMPGVEVLANTAQMALTSQYLYRAPIVWTAGIVLLLALFFLLTVWRRGVGMGLLIGVTSGVLWVFIARWLFLREHLYVTTIPPLAFLGLVVTLLTTYEIIRTQRALGQFLPSWVMQQAMTGRVGQNTMQQRPVTVVFCDIRGFTAYAELHTPEETVALLNAYYAAGDTAAKECGTELDKFIGDAMMLYFFDKKGSDTHPLRAVRWAQRMQEVAERLDITVGTGIASGIASEGVIGAGRRLQSTVIGDVVNLAARLQDHTKVSAPIVMNLTAADATKNELTIEPLGAINVRGKKEPVAVFTVK